MDRKKQKRLAAIHDISGFGKCSLTVALPIISAAGIETSVMPTAVLSTHTGGFKNYTYRDLTEDLLPFMNHWKSLHLNFDAIYTGFLGSFRQLDLVSEFFDKFKTTDNLILVDPVMADNGVLYSLFDSGFAKGMKNLCSKADIIIPNLTEASLMLGEEYREGPYGKGYIEDLLHKLSRIGPKKIVLTGVYFNKDELGAATYDAEKDIVSFAFAPRIPGNYHGTGDVFGSALLGALLNDFDLNRSAEIAANFTSASIKRTYEAKTDIRFGVDFEQELPEFIRNLKLSD